MPLRLRAARRVILSLGTALVCQTVTAGCGRAEAPDTALAELTFSYRGERLSDAKVLARLGEEVRVDTVTDDGRSAAVKLRIVRASAEAYRTSVDLEVDGAAVGATEFLSTPGQSVASEGPEVRLALRVQPGA
jgi:hypothetical protein